MDAHDWHWVPRIAQVRPEVRLRRCLCVLHHGRASTEATVESIILGRKSRYVPLRFSKYHLFPRNSLSLSFSLALVVKQQKPAARLCLAGSSRLKREVYERVCYMNLGRAAYSQQSLLHSREIAQPEASGRTHSLAHGPSAWEQGEVGGQRITCLLAELG